MSKNENAVTLFGGSPVSLKANKQAMAEALQTAANDDPRGSADGLDYLNFSGKRGVYERGQEKQDMDQEEIWLVNVMSLQRGWICWKGGRPVATRMAPIFSGTPIPDPDFDQHGPFDDSKDGWFVRHQMDLKSLEEAGEGVQFATNSKSGVNAMTSLEKSIMENLMDDEPAWPVIRFGKEKFTANGNTNYKPVFHIYGWLDDVQVEALSLMEEVNGDVIDDLMAGQIDVEALIAGEKTAASDTGEKTQGFADEVDEAEEAEEVETKTRPRRGTKTDEKSDRRAGRRSGRRAAV